MPKWEYIYAKFHTDDTVRSENGQALNGTGGFPVIHEYLEAKGADGWELVAMDRTGRLFLKREQQRRPGSSGQPVVGGSRPTLPRL